MKIHHITVANKKHFHLDILNNSTYLNKIETIVLGLNMPNIKIGHGKGFGWKLMLLRDYLENNFTSLQWKHKIQMALEITCGLMCLHSKGIIHRDLVNQRFVFIIFLTLLVISSTFFFHSTIFSLSISNILIILLCWSYVHTKNGRLMRRRTRRWFYS